ncbi:hypothetical protein B484DRAFT_407089, partial [Ochromonadaceae sp. CCMP2298]
MDGEMDGQTETQTQTLEPSNIVTTVLEEEDEYGFDSSPRSPPPLTVPATSQRLSHASQKVSGSQKLLRAGAASKKGHVFYDGHDEIYQQVVVSAEVTTQDAVDYFLKRMWAEVRKFKSLKAGVARERSSVQSSFSAFSE